MKNPKLTFGIIAFISGIVAIILAVSSGDGGFTYDEKTQTIKEKGIGYFKEKVLNRADKVQLGRQFVVQNTGVLAFGLIAVVLGAGTNFIKVREKKKTQEHAYFYFDTSSAALTLGLVALLWSYIIIAIIIGVILYIFSGLMSGSIDIGF